MLVSGKLSFAFISPVASADKKRDAADVRAGGGDEMEICPSGMKQKLTPLSLPSSVPEKAAATAAGDALGSPQGQSS